MSETKKAKRKQTNKKKETKYENHKTSKADLVLNKPTNKQTNKQWRS